MEHQERFENLSPPEMATLKKNKQSFLTTLIAVNVLLLILGVWIGWRGSWLYRATYLLFLLLTIVFISWGKLRSALSLGRDIQEGKKKIIVNRIESQRQDIRQTGNSSSPVDDALGASGPSMSYAYLIKVQGKEMSVSERQYYQCKPGQLVEIQLAPNSNHLFSFCLLDEPAAEVNSQTEST